MVYCPSSSWVDIRLCRHETLRLMVGFLPSSCQPSQDFIRLVRYPNDYPRITSPWDIPQLFQKYPQTFPFYSYYHYPHYQLLLNIAVMYPYENTISVLLAIIPIINMVHSPSVVGYLFPGTGITPIFVGNQANWEAIVPLSPNPFPNQPWQIRIKHELALAVILVVWNMTFIFPYLWNVIIPVDELQSFSQGYAKNHQPVNHQKSVSLS